MKRSIRKDTFREIKGTLGRFFSIMLLITLGVAFFVGLRMSSVDMRSTADQYFDDTSFADYRMISTVGFQNEDIEAIGAVEGVAALSRQKNADALMKIESQDVVVRVLGEESDLLREKSRSINQLTLLEGRYPNQVDEVLLDERGESIFGIQIGDVISLASGTDTVLDETLKHTKLTVVGTVRSPVFVSLERGTSTIGNGKLEFFLVGQATLFKGDIWHEVNITVEDTKELQTFDTAYSEQIASVEERLQQLGKARSTQFYQENVVDILEELSEQEQVLDQQAKEVEQQFAASLEAGLAYNSALLAQAEAEKNGYLSKIEKDREELQRAKEQVAGIPDVEWFVLDREKNSGYVEFQDSTKSIEGLSAVFPTFLFLVAALVCLTTMTRMVGEQRSYIGTLKALGYGKISIAMKYITYSASATLLGSLLGSLIGIYLLPIAVYIPYLNMFSTPDLILEFDWINILIATGLALLFTVVPTIFSCMKELRETAASLLRPKAPAIGKKILLERMPFLWKRLSFIYKVTLRNIFRYKKHFLMAVFGISGCTALLVLGFGLKDSIGSIITQQYEKVFQYQVSATLEKDQSIPTAVRNLKEIEGLLAVSQETIDISHNQTDKSIVVTVPEHTSELKDYILLQTRTDQKPIELTDDGVILSEKMAKILDVQVDDELTVKLSPSKGKEVKVLGITENYFYHHLYMTANLYQDIFGIQPTFDTILAKVDKNLLQDEKDFIQNLMAYEEIQSASFQASTGGVMDQLMSSLNGVVGILIGSAGLLAFIVLYNLTNVNISERIREIATIKVLGFYNQEVGKYIFRENIILTVLGTTVGLGLGVLLHNYTLSATEMDYSMFPRIIQEMSFVYSGALTVAFSLLVNVVMYFKLKHVNMVESLKSVE